jgi:hypothetical protein
MRDPISFNELGWLKDAATFHAQVCLMSPAGMEPLGSVRHGRSPKGERAGASESIEPSFCATITLANPCGAS